MYKIGIKRVMHSGGSFEAVFLAQFPYLPIFKGGIFFFFLVLGVGFVSASMFGLFTLVIPSCDTRDFPRMFEYQSSWRVEL